MKRSYIALEGDRLNILKKNNPKQFFAKFKKKFKALSKETIGDFYEDFKSITSCTSQSDIFRSEGSEGGCIFEELDKSISVNEIKEAVSNLKRGKLHGEDGILNEYFIEFYDYLLPVMHNLFNCILDTGIFPSTWSSSIIIPVYKKR